MAADATDTDLHAHKCAFSVQLDVALEPQAFHAPSFRFRFVDGSKRQTPVVGAAGWTAHADGAAGRWRFDVAIADVVVGETLAAAIDDDPIVAFVLSDHATGGAAAAAAAAPVKGGDAKGRPTTAAAAPPEIGGGGAWSGRGRLVADLFELDASAFFAADCLHVEQTWVGSAAADGATIPSAADGDDGDDAQSIFARLKQRNATATRGERDGAARSLFAAASGVRFVSIRIGVDQPVLSPALAKRLNPLTVTVGTARRLPGVAAASGGGSSGDPHAPLRGRCRPAYALWRFFPSRLSARLVVTPGREQHETVEWQHATTVLCGRCDATELHDALHAASLSVELHDRDAFQDDALAKLQRKWESLHTTGVDATATASAAADGGGGGGGGGGSTGGSQHATPRGGATGAQAAPPKPLDAFAVDEIARRDWRALVGRAGEAFAFGAASFRLDELLWKAKALSVGGGGGGFGASHPYMKLKLTADVLASKRRAQPIGAAAVAELDDDTRDAGAVRPTDATPLDKLVREPGAFVASGATLSLHIVLQQPVARPPPSPPSPSPSPSSSSFSPHEKPPLFSRFVLLFPYRDAATLAQLMRVLEQTNRRAFADDRGVSVRSYQLTPQEKRASDDGALNILTGCMVLDDELRLVILEGLADGAMRELHRAVPRTKPQSESFRMYANEQLRFPRRLYTAFEIDLKRIKLRHALPRLLQMPDIYLRTKVAEPCFAALTKLMELRRVSRLAEAHELDLFPTADMLLEVESKYGESISLEDIYGKRKTGASVASTATISRHRGRAVSGAAAVEPATDGGADDGADDGDGDGNGDDDDDDEHRKQDPPRPFTYTHWKAPTDATNAQFDELRRSRQETDFLDQRRKLHDAQQRAYRQRRQAEDEALAADPSARGPVYLYSGQKLRSQDALQEELRRQLAKDHRATFTYGAQFQSLALSLVNPDELRQTEEREARKKWTTQRGFVYPAPRPTAEYYQHADAPSEARCEDLRVPFVDNANHPKPVSRDNNRDRDPRSAFSTLPSKDRIFGGTNGDGSANADYFRSVHLCGDGLRKEMEEALQKEQDDWERKLVVDKKQIKFVAHGNTCSLPPARGPQSSQLDRLRDILSGPVQSKPLRIVRHAALPSGKRVPLQAPPASITSLHEYTGPVAATFASTLRQSDAATPFLATDVTTGKPKDFHFPSVTDLLTPPVKKHTTHNEIRSVKNQEKLGFLWSNHNQ